MGQGERVIWCLLIPTALALSPVEAQAILQIEAQRLPPLALESFVTSEEAATRARAARALGHLRSPGAVLPLEELSADTDVAVRIEAAFALGQTPGGGPRLLAWLATEPEAQVRARICEGLGKEGEANAVPALLAALGHTPPFLRPAEEPAAAAIALGRLGMRHVEAARQPEVAAALLDQLRRFDRDLRQGAAFALARMAPTGLPPADRDLLLTAATRDSDPVVRAFLIRAASGLSEDQALVGEILAKGALDRAPGVRVAVARAAARTGWPEVVTLLTDGDPGVRLEAIAATGEVPGLDHMTLLGPLLEAGGTLEAAERKRTMGDGAVLEAAAALGALVAAEATVDLDRWLDLSRPTELRAAAAAATKDPATLRELALKDGEAPVRTAAAGALTELDVEVDEILPLLGAFDAIVAATGADWLGAHPSAHSEGPLLDALAGAEDLDLLTSGARALTALYADGGPIPARRADPRAAPFAQACLGSPARPLAEAAEDLAGALGKPAESSAHHIFAVPLDEVSTMRLARVETDRGIFTIRLSPEEAPITVWNFGGLAEQGYFDGLRVHRVVPDFVMQDGDPRGDGAGGPGWTIPDEINPLSYETGAVGMALSGPDTGGSQWFVTLSPQPHLNGGYTVFGKVIEGMAVVRAIQPGDRIRRIKIERFPAR